MDPYKILVVDDSPDILTLARELLQSHGYSVDIAETFDEALRLLAGKSYDAILVDYKLGTEDGGQLVSEILGEDPTQSVLMMTAYGSIEKAVEAVKSGVFGYITKPFEAEQLVGEISKACERSALKKENRKLREMLTEKGGIANIIGTSPLMLRLFDQVRQVAQVDSTVLITGESGSGKELIARAVHDLSPRAKNRFGAINCGAIPANLLESELFGHKRGAFTDARTDRKGLFESCNNGSLFLDEIGEMPIELQVKLLRVLQEKEIVPLGSDRPVQVDVRIITATNKNLRDEVKKSRFREDLYFRINVIPLHVPALRERREDIPLLVTHFLEQYSSQFGKKMERVPEEMMRQLTIYNWPGNVRELQNNIERAVVMSTDGKIHEEHLFMEKSWLGDVIHGDAGDGWSLGSGGPLLPYSEAKEEFEKGYLHRLLEASGGNVADAARLAGRFTTDIHRLLNKYHIKQPRK